MKLKIWLSAQERKELNINYNYQLSAAIYNLLHFGSNEFAEFLHDKGYQLNGKKYKLFCFALQFVDAKFEKGLVHLIKPEAVLYISSPLVDDFIKNFIIGSFENQQIKIHYNYKDIIFNITQIEALPEPEYCEQMKFKMLSPLVLSTKIEEKGKLKTYYYRYDDDITVLSKTLTKNLQNKYKIIFNKDIDAGDLEFSWDQNYINRQLSKGKRISTKTTIDEYDKRIDVIGIKAPFTLKGNKELIRIGYECGFGEKNSMGFGMVETNFIDTNFTN